MTVVGMLKEPRRCSSVPALGKGFMVTEKSEEYRRLAATCLEMAREREQPQHRALLLQMAQIWARLAAERTDDAEAVDPSAPQ